MTIKLKTDKDVMTQRPFRLYNAVTKKFLPWRCYKHKRRAHLGAMLDCRWAQVGTTIEVIDVSVAHMDGQYTRRAHTIDFRGA